MRICLILAFFGVFAHSPVHAQSIGSELDSATIGSGEIVSPETCEECAFYTSSDAWTPKRGESYCSKDRVAFLMRCYVACFDSRNPLSAIPKQWLRLCNRLVPNSTPILPGITLEYEVGR